MRPEVDGGHGTRSAGVRRPASNLCWFGFTAVITMTAGTVFLMWLGEQIDEYGIGNGISLIIMAGIVARIPDATGTLLIDSTTGKLKESVFTLGGATGDISFEKLLVLTFLFVAVVVGVIAMTKAQRRIPTQSRQARPRPARVRRHAPVPADEGERGRRHARHLRQHAAHPAVVPVQHHRQPDPDAAGPATLATMFRRTAGGCTTSCTSS